VVLFTLAMAPVTALTSPIEPGAIEVVDGDTIRTGGRTFRLVGFDTPETGSGARCEYERTLAAAASRRLRQLIATGGLDLERVACSCRPGNHGRLCGTLRARGHDVGAILISEGLARPFL
jgi:endonuclease YncB( thermonuclease family)